MSDALLGVIIGGVIGLLGGLLGQAISARVQRQQQKRDMQRKACEDLYVELGRLRAAKIVESYLNPDQRRDRRSFLEIEMETVEVNDSLTRLTIGVLDRELRDTIRQFVGFRGRLEEFDDYVSLIEQLQDRCGGLVRGDKNLASLADVVAAIEVVDPESDSNMDARRQVAEIEREQREAAKGEGG